MSGGLRHRLDSVNEPAGSFRVLTNAKITSRGGLAKRDGISVIGDYDASGDAVVGLYAFEKADGTKTLLKALGSRHQYLDTNWVSLETGLTASKTDYAPHVVNTADDDYLYFTSRENGYKRWKGWYSRTTAILAGGETEIPVTSTLKADIYYGNTASACGTTTIDVSGSPWAANQWIGFYVRITSGAQSGKISPITATTTGQISFTAIAGLSGTPTFEIRQLDVPATGTVIVNGTSVAYTGVTNDDSLTVASAPSCASGSSVVLVPTSYPANPKGAAIDVWLTKILVADIKSAMARNGSGNEVATSVNRAVFVSKLGDGTDFRFSSPRSANEGDIISLAYGGGKVVDVAAQEDAIVVGTPNYIEKITYTQSTDATGAATDLVQREPLKPGIGITGRFVKGTDDIYFFTPSGMLTSLGRVENKDSTQQTLDIGFPIRGLLEGRINTNADGLDWQNRLHFCQEKDSSHNDRILVYNKTTKSFEGDWLLPANGFAIWEGKPCFGCSNSANVMRMYDGTNDTWDGVDYPISSEAKSNWINLTPSGMEDQSVTGFHVAGYIRGNTKVTYYLYADYSDVPVLTVDFSGNETQFTYDINVNGSLGQLPLGEQPLGSIDEEDEDGYRRFRFSVWFPDIYANVFSWGVKDGGLDSFIETSQVGFSVSADPLNVGVGLIKS